VSEPQDALAARSGRALAGNAARDAAKLARQKKLAVRERLALLIDPGSFAEDGLLANTNEPDLPADGVVTGTGRIEGRPVCVIANDPTVKAGSWGARTVEKIVRMTEHALRHELPIMWLVDSAGARITDQIDMFPGRRGAGRIFANQVTLSGVAPQICCLFGPSAAGGAYIPSFCDVVIMVEGNASMYLGSPRMAEEVIGERVTLEEMGGARMHATVSGCGDNLATDDADAIDQARLLFSYLPSSWRQLSPVARGTEPLRVLSRAELPDEESSGYDMHGVIDCIVDADTLYEIKPLFATELITGFARLDGHTVGVVASNPAEKGGVLFVDSSDKAARFIWMCDAYNVPLLFLADVPGFMIGTQVERQGIIRHGAKMVAAVTEATVPKISVIVRKAYGAGLYAFSGRDPRPPDRQDRRHGPRRRGQRRLRQQDRRHRRPRRAPGLRGRAAIGVRGRRRPLPPGGRPARRRRRALRGPARRAPQPLLDGRSRRSPGGAEAPRRAPRLTLG
jgi:acetyl-CoA carboxylase carboxyltransferase component